MDFDTARHKCQEADLLLKQAQKTVERTDRKRLILLACRLYQEVLADESVEIPDPYIGLAYLIFSSGDKEKALQLLETAIALSPPAELRAQQVMNQLKRAAEPALPGQSQSIRQVSSLRPREEEDVYDDEDEYDEYEDQDDEHSPVSDPQLVEIAEHLEELVFELPDFDDE